MRTLFLVPLVLLFACEKMQPQTPSEIYPKEKPPMEQVETQKEQVTEPIIESISVPNMLFHTDSDNPILINVEMADSPASRRKGLQHRASLGENYGMLFVFEEDSQEPFWMKDTFIPLDLIFLDKDYNVVDIIENTEPGSEKLLNSRVPYRYVLEVNAGSIKKHDIRTADRAEFRLGPK